jgi:TolA-binding protein
MTINYYIRLLLLTPLSLLINTSILADTNGFVTRQQALVCIQINNDLLFSQHQASLSANRKQHLKSKIDYLHNEIQKRRNLINDLDQQKNQSNNKNYNQLITQFESLIEERKQTIALYEDEDQQHITHHQNVNRLDEQYLHQCSNNIQITQKLYKDVCNSLDNRWCSSFNF